MANEVVIVELNEHMDAKQYTCAEGISISKGTLLELSGDNTVLKGTGTNAYAGVAAADKDGDDTSTTIAVYTPGQGNKFDMTCSSAAVTLGAWVVISGANTIRDAVTTEVEEGKAIGRTEETGGAAEVIVVLS